MKAQSRCQLELQLSEGLTGTGRALPKQFTPMSGKQAMATGRRPQFSARGSLHNLLGCPHDMAAK